MTIFFLVVGFCILAWLAYVWLPFVGDSVFRKGSKELAEKVIKSLSERPDDWTFGEFTAVCGDFEMWTANRPYADLRIAYTEESIGTWQQRRQIRKLIESILVKKATETLLGRVSE